MILKKEIKCGGIQQIEFGNNSFNKQQIFRNNKFFFILYIYNAIENSHTQSFAITK
jgi:hypothetical protein